MVFQQVVCLVVLILFDHNVDYYKNTKPEHIVLIIFYGSLCLFGLIKAKDLDSQESENVESYYNVINDSFIKPKSIKELEEKAWDKFNDISYYDEEEKFMETNRRKSLREKIHRIAVEGHEIDENTRDPIVYYIVRVYKGISGKKVEQTKRRFREFLSLYKELKAQYPFHIIPQFPSRCSNK